VSQHHRHLSELDAGVALALAAQGPDLTGNERFGIGVNYGNYEGTGAIGVGLTGVVLPTVGQSGRLAVTGAFGMGFQDGRYSSKDVIGGRVGAQFTW
jgi:trimeric autotransporter adhesin